MKRRRYLRSLCFLLVALGQFALHRPSEGNGIVDAGEFGLLELKPGADATPIIRRAIEACRERHAVGLRIPPGTWHLRPDLAFEKYLSIANNDSGLKRVVFQLEHLNNFALDAKGALFICHGQMVPFAATDCRRLTLSGFTIDWERPFYFQGSVTALHPELNAFDVLVHPEVIYEQRGERLVFREKPSRTPNAWRDWAPPPTADMAWEHNIQWNVWFHGDSKHPVLNEQTWAMVPDPRAVEPAPGTVRFFDALKQLPELGMVLVVNGMRDPNRTAPAIHIDDCSAVTVEGVTIHHAGGMGVVMQRTDGATLRNLRISLPDGKNRYVTTTADATHFNGCRGTILLEGCEFENMLDDATNVHGCFVRIDRQLDKRTLLCRRCHSQQRGLVVMAAGDTVGFVTSADLQQYGTAQVVATRELNIDLFEVTLDRLPEGGLKPSSALYNLSWQPALCVRNCSVRNNRGRSMLIATAGEVVIEKNRFEYSSMAGIQFEGDNSFWWESGPSKHVEIRDNVFLNLGGPVLSMIPQIDAHQFPNARYHGGVVFENNDLYTFHRRIVFGRAVDGLVFQSNQISTTNYFVDLDVASPAFLVESGHPIVIEKNVFTSEPPLTVRCGDTDAPTISGNQGIVLMD